MMIMIEFSEIFGEYRQNFVFQLPSFCRSKKFSLKLVSSFCAIWKLIWLFHCFIQIYYYYIILLIAWIITLLYLTIQKKKMATQNCHIWSIFDDFSAPKKKSIFSISASPTHFFLASFTCTFTYYYIWLVKNSTRFSAKVCFIYKRLFFLSIFVL